MIDNNKASQTEGTQKGDCCSAFESTNLLSAVISEVERCLYNYESSFHVTAELEDEHENKKYFHVTITQEIIPEDKIYFFVKYDSDGFEMEIGEDAWYDLDSENLFSLLYFEVAMKLRNYYLSR